MMTVFSFPQLINPIPIPEASYDVFSFNIIKVFKPRSYIFNAIIGSYLSHLSVAITSFGIY